MKKLAFLSVAIFAIVSLSSFSVSDVMDAGRWVKLGSKKVNYGLDRDVIRVGAKEGGFTKLKVKVTGGALNMHRMIVEYGNGSKDEINLRHNFSKRTASRVVDLNGGKRIIKDITFWYDTKNLARKKARVTVFGRR